MTSTKSWFVDEIAESENIIIFVDDSLESSDVVNEKKVFHYRFGSGYIVYDEDSIEDVVLVQFDSGFRKKVFIYDLENS